MKLKLSDRQEVEETLHSLDNTCTMHIVGLDDDDIRRRSREEKVADKLMGRREFSTGTFGIHKHNYNSFIMIKGKWVRVIRGEDGKHRLDV